MAKLSQERSAVSNRVAQVRHERSPDPGSKTPVTRRARRKPGDATARPADADGRQDEASRVTGRGPWSP
jgi:hypothetical protein